VGGDPPANQTALQRKSNRSVDLRWRCAPVDCSRVARLLLARAQSDEGRSISRAQTRVDVMINAAPTTRFRCWLWLIRVIGVIVPRRWRATWRQEWEAELRHREELLADWDRLDWRSKLDLLRRSASAFWDALWLQPRRLEDEMIQDLRYGVRMWMKN